MLVEDGEWHQAIVESTEAGVGASSISSRQTAGGTVLVRFIEWGKVQRTAARDVTRLASVVDDDEEGDSGGRLRGCDCEICGRMTKLTFHHLVPKETHHRYVGKCLPEGLLDAVPDAEPTRIFLNSYGAMLCRPCHSTVHKFAPNGVLAQRFFTLERLLAQEPIQRWAKFAAKSLKR